MAELVTYDRSDLVSTLTMDDGKVNVFSIPMLQALHEAFDQAERDSRWSCYGAGPATSPPGST